jgi:hypothetical protein
MVPITLAVEVDIPSWRCDEISRTVAGRQPAEDLERWRAATDTPLLVLAIASLPILLLELARTELPYSDRLSAPAATAPQVRGKGPSAKAHRRRIARWADKRSRAASSCRGTRNAATNPSTTASTLATTARNELPSLTSLAMPDSDVVIMNSRTSVVISHAYGAPHKTPPTRSPTVPKGTTLARVQFAGEDLMTMLYPERQLIVVVRDDAVGLVQRATSGDAPRRWARAAPWIKSSFALRISLAAAASATHLRKLRQRSDRANLRYLVVTTSQAKNLRFPTGHPLRNTVYAGDPGVVGRYYPIASFHRILFEGKVAEVLRLLRSLGATEISIEYLEGFRRGAGVDLTVAVPAEVDVNVGGGVNATTTARSSAKTTMHLSPTMSAQLPTDLVWFQSEPLWQEVAKARLEAGLRSFTIDVNYADDYGINADLEAMIKDVGLQFGGSFTEYRETVWKLSGSFAEKLPRDAASG